MSNPRCCSPSCSVPGAASPPASLSPHHEGRALKGTRVTCESSQPEPQKQGMSKFTGSGRVFSSDMRKCTWEVGAQQHQGFGDDRLGRRRMRWAAVQPRRWAPHEPFPGSSLSSPQEHCTASLLTARDELQYPKQEHIAFRAVTNIQVHWQQMLLMMPIHIFLLIFHTRLVSICK